MSTISDTKNPQDFIKPMTVIRNLTFEPKDDCDDETKTDTKLQAPPRKQKSKQRYEIRQESRKRNRERIAWLRGKRWFLHSRAENEERRFCSTSTSITDIKYEALKLPTVSKINDNRNETVIKSILIARFG